MKEWVVRSSTISATNDYRKTLKRLSTIDYEIENRPHAPGLPGGVMGGLFVWRFFGFSEFSPLRLIAATAGGAGEAVRADLRRLVVFLPI